MPHRRCTAALAAAIALLAAGASAAAPPAATSFRTFDCKAGGFSILMPGAPQASPRQVSTPFGTFTLKLYMAKYTESAFVAGYLDIPASTGHIDTNKMLDGVCKGSASSAHGTLVSSAATTIEGFPARDYVVDVPNGGGVCHGRAVLAGRRLIVAIAAGSKAAASRSEFARVLGSLRIQRSR